MPTIRIPLCVFRAALTLLASVAIGSAADVRRDVLLFWNHQLAESSLASQSPHLAARDYALVNVAIGGALGEIRRSFHPSSTEDGLERTAVASAIRQVLDAVAPDDRRRLDGLFSQECALIADATLRARIVEVGVHEAEKVVAMRSTDGWCSIDPQLPPTSSDRPRDAEIRVPKSPWLGARPFVLKSVEQFSPRLTVWYDAEGAPQRDYYLTRAKLFDQVDRVQAAGASAYWAGSPVVNWNSIANVMLADSDLDELERARILTVLNLAIADATESALHWHYVLGNWRTRVAYHWEPATGTAMLSAVAATDDYGTPVLVHEEPHQELIPPLRNYPSLGATVAGAAAAVLTTVRGAHGVVLTTGEQGAPASVRTFASVSDAARECAFASSLDGRHTRESCVAGFELGEQIGKYVVRVKGKSALALAP